MALLGAASLKGIGKGSSLPSALLNAPTEPPTISKANRGKGGLWGSRPITVPGPRPGLQKRQVVPPPPSPLNTVFLPFISESSHQYSNKAGAAPRLCAPLTAQHGQGCATLLCSPCQAPGGTESTAAPHHHTEPGTTLPPPSLLPPQRISGVRAGEKGNRQTGCRMGSSAWQGSTQSTELGYW